VKFLSSTMAGWRDASCFFSRPLLVTGGQQLS